MAGAPHRVGAERSRARRLLVLAALAAGLAAASAVEAAVPQPPAAPRPPAGLVFKDVPNDAGHAIDLDWTPSPDDSAAMAVVTGYELLRGSSPLGPWSAIDSVAAGVKHYRDNSAHLDSAYFYRVVAVGPGGRTPAGAVAGPAVARAVWYLTRWAALGAAALVVALAWNVISRRARRSASASAETSGDS